jgi:hypothetical protein
MYQIWLTGDHEYQENISMKNKVYVLGGFKPGIINSGNYIPSNWERNIDEYETVLKAIGTGILITGIENTTNCNGVTLQICP